MISHTRLAACGLLLASLSASAPNPVAEVLEERAVNPAWKPLPALECLVVDLIVLELKGVGQKASAFCSSYLSIPALTVVATTTVTSLPPPVTKVSTKTPATATSTDLIVTTETTSTTTVYSAFVPPANPKDKRDGVIPSYIPKAVPALLSKACSCLTISQSTTTLKTSSTKTLPAQTILTTTTLATPTTVVSSTTTAAVSTVIPALCNPTNYIFSDGANSMSPQQFAVDTFTLGSKIDCCIQCFNTLGCFYYRWTPSSDGCLVYSNAQGSLPGGEVASKCPLGVVAGAFLDPNRTPVSEAEYGPCAQEANLG